MDRRPPSYSHRLHEMPKENLGLVAFVQKIKAEPFVRAFEAFSKPPLQRTEGIKAVETQNAQVQDKLGIKGSKFLRGYYASTDIARNLGSLRNLIHFTEFTSHFTIRENIAPLPLVMSEASLAAYMELLSLNLSEADIKHFTPEIFNWALHTAKVCSFFTTYRKMQVLTLFFHHPASEEIPSYLISIADHSSKLFTFLLDANMYELSRGKKMAPHFEVYLDAPLFAGETYHTHTATALSDYAPEAFTDAEATLKRGELSSSLRDLYPYGQQFYARNIYQVEIEKNPQTDMPAPHAYQALKGTAEFVSRQQYYTVLKEKLTQIVDSVVTNEKLKDGEYTIFLPDFSYHLLQAEQKHLEKSRAVTDRTGQHIEKNFDNLLEQCGIERDYIVVHGIMRYGYKATEKQLKQLISMVIAHGMRSNDDEQTMPLSLFAVLSRSSVVLNKPEAQEKGVHLYSGKKSRMT